MQDPYSDKKVVKLKVASANQPTRMSKPTFNVKKPVMKLGQKSKLQMPVNE
jgi:hypothetical protein